MDRVAAVRKLLPLTRFNNTPRVQHGIKRLRRFRRKWNDTLNSYTTPMHDENSHGADAFGEYAINCPVELPRPKKPKMAELHYLEVQPDGSVRSNLTITEIVNMKKRKRKLLEA
jgi:hypothetical protein